VAVRAATPLTVAPTGVHPPATGAAPATGAVVTVVDSTVVEGAVVAVPSGAVVAATAWEEVAAGPCPSADLPPGDEQAATARAAAASHTPRRRPLAVAICVKYPPACIAVHGNLR
jgi:hypothetical protein